MRIIGRKFHRNWRWVAGGPLQPLDLLWLWQRFHQLTCGPIVTPSSCCSLEVHITSYLLHCTPCCLIYAYTLQLTTGWQHSRHTLPRNHPAPAAARLPLTCALRARRTFGQPCLKRAATSLTTHLLPLFPIRPQSARCMATQALHNPNAITKKVYFDVEIGPNKAGRIVMGLYGKVRQRIARAVNEASCAWLLCTRPARVRGGPDEACEDFPPSRPCTAVGRWHVLRRSCKRCC